MVTSTTNAATLERFYRLQRGRGQVHRSSTSFKIINKNGDTL